MEHLLKKLEGAQTVELDFSNSGLTSLMQQVKYIPLLQHITTCPNL